MIANDNHGRSLLAGERVELLASEMRRVRVAGPEEVDHESWTGVALRLLTRVQRVARHRDDGSGSPAYDA